ncbi:MAG: helix-turn-helix domain-containing protein [Gemmatimonadaceae bacterium]|nr:helix-turn-helix domain-containing protein [Gemmatimonadaceae bacterium]
MPTMPESMNGDEVRRRRKALELSQDGLARLLLVTRQTVYSWERGLRTPPGMLALALEAIEKRKTWSALREAMQKREGALDVERES